MFVDTAGIRRKGKTHLMAEKMSVVMARRHLRMSNVAILVLDATEPDGIVALDATIAGYAHEEGRAVILCVNKWDAAFGDEPLHKKKQAFLEKIQDELKFLDYAPVAFVSAQKRQGTRALFPMIKKVYDSASKRIGTGELNRFVETLQLGVLRQDSLHDAGFRSSADVHCVYGPAQSALFGGTISDQPAARKIRIRRDADRDQDQAPVTYCPHNRGGRARSGWLCKLPGPLPRDRW